MTTKLLFSPGKRSNTRSSEKDTAEACNEADEDHGVAVRFGSGGMSCSCGTKTCYQSRSLTRVAVRLVLSVCLPENTHINK